MVKNVVFFPGQGAQYPGMGAALLKKNLRTADRLERMSDLLGADLGAVLAEGPEDLLKETRFAQPALALVSLTVWEILEEAGVSESAAVAGFSLGELPALAAAGFLNREEMLDLVCHRALAMDSASKALDPGAGMAAVVGLSSEEVIRAAGIVEGLYPVNFNSPVQTVVAGTAAGLNQAEELFRSAGARRVIPLKVAGPFHSPLMQKAADLFAEAAAGVAWHDAERLFFSNVTGKAVYEGTAAADLAVRQIVSPVRWTDIEEAAASLNPETVWEAGPGKVLAGLWKSAGSDPAYQIPCRSAMESLEVVTHG